MEEIKTRGGARAGAGRKAKELRNLSLELELKLIAEIDDIRGAIPRTRWLKQAIREKLDREKISLTP